MIMAEKQTLGHFLLPRAEAVFGMPDCRTDSGDIHLLLSLPAEGDCCTQALRRYKRLLEDR